MALILQHLPVAKAAVHWLLYSVRGRFLFISAFFLAVLLGFALYTWNMVSETSSRTNLIITDYYTLEYQSLQKLAVDIRDLETAIYQYAVLLDEPLRDDISDRIDTLLYDVEQLSRWSEQKEMKEVEATTRELGQRLHKLKEGVEQLLTLLDTAQHRYPAIETIFNQMYPSHQAVMAAIMLAISEVENEGSGAETKRNHILWQRLEHAWMQYAFESRMFIANRSGVFGDPENMSINHENHLLWMESLDALLEQLSSRARDGKLGLQQTESVSDIATNYARYENGYRHVHALMTSGGWRLDLPYLREHIRPAFYAVRTSSILLREQFTEKMKAALAQSQYLSGRLVKYILALTALTVLLILLSYYVFIRFIYRPLKEVAVAMESAGRGENYSLLRTGHIDEIDMLVHAYDGMQAQVHSREVRLRSILENISDGIITIDEFGRIETFNKAAQNLFDYSFEEAYGQPVALLMPDSMKRHHPQYIENYKQHGIRHAIDREREEMAQRKDGSLFPMSIKVKEMVLDDQRFFTAVVADISERKAAMERLREMAEKDALTGLHNRRYFLDELERAVNRAIRGGVNVTLLYIDLDNFKFVNDTMGHLAGDQVLIEVTEMLGNRVRSGDLFARLGGDEFAVLLYQVDEETAVRVADSYRQLLAEYSFKYDGRIVDIGCSIGVARYTEGINNKEDLLARADLACHIAKRSGRNRLHLFDASSQEEADGMSADMGWARRIKEAIEEDGFVLAYQPILRSEEGTVHSHEVLLRMRGVDGELITPAGFLPAAERFGLMVELDLWVIEHAILALREARVQRRDIKLNINLSAPSVETLTILDAVRDLLARYEVDARCLVFEITETTAITKLAHAVELLDGLKALGCSTALDDFGTGYSSFAYLKELPVDYVKIDGSFVQNLDRDRLNQVMVRSMHEVARAMGKRSVAEFVESEAVMHTLREIGVDYQQGYYLGKPELNLTL